MSILWTLRKHIDAAQHREDEARRRKALDVPHQIRDEGAGERRCSAEPDKPTVRYRCRVCEHVGDTAEYCPECLADTMEPDVASAAGGGR